MTTLSPERLHDVATAYQVYASVGQDPVAAVAQQFGCPVRTAHRWIYIARKNGHLPPSGQGNSGYVGKGYLPKPLRQAIEVLLLNHQHELSGEDVDADLSELAYVYKAVTGWTADRGSPQ